MAVYAYIARQANTRSASPTRGTIAADSPRQARDQLRAQGLSVREIVEQKAGGATRSALSRYLIARQRGQVTGLLQELSTLLAADIPLLDALDTITRQHQGRFKQSIMLLRDHVSAGGGLAEAMALQPELFDELARNIVEVGENAGTLDASLARLVAFRRQASKLKNRVASAMIYPIIVMCVGVAVSIFLMTFVVPKVLGVLLQSGNDLPWATVIVKGISDFLIGWWWLLLAGALAGGLGMAALLRSERGGMAWHRLQLRLPLIGELTRKQAIARMSMVMATLLKSDVVFVQAVRIAQDTVRNRVLKDALMACERAIMSGRDIGDALEATHAFPPLVVQVFAVGQASGRLEPMLEDLAHDYDTQVDITAGRLTALLEPVMIILLAITVGFIAFAVIMPILNAGDVL